MVNIVTSTHCSGSGFAILLAYGFWYGFTGVLYYCEDITLLWISILYYPQVFLNHVLRLLIAEKFPNSCRSGFESPSVETQITFSFLAYVLVISSYRGRSIGKLNYLLLFSGSLYVPLALFFSGDSSFNSILGGIFLGVIFSFLTLVLFKIYVDPLYKCALGWDFVKNQHYVDNIFVKKCSTSYSKRKKSEKSEYLPMHHNVLFSDAT